MKQIKKITSLILISSLFLSCSTIVKMVNGEKKIKEETHDSVKEFAEEQKLAIDFKRNFYLKNRMNNEVFASFKPAYNSAEKISLPDMYFFDHNGRYLENENVCYRLMKVTEEFDYYHDYFTSEDLIYHSSKQLKDLQNILVNHQGKPIQSFDEKPKDTHYAFVLWSKYKGRKWAKETNFIIKQLNNSAVDFEIYFLNMDLVIFES